MKYRNIKYLVVIFASCFLWSCKKELNVYPTTSEVDGNVIVDTKSASTVLNGVYYRFANAGLDSYTSSLTVGWSDINETIPSELANTMSVVGGGDVFNDLALNSKTYGVDAIWNYGYQLVNAANGFLKNVAPVTTIPAATKSQMIAEAKFLRAFGNAELLLFYGQYYDPTSKYGIILRDEFVTASTTNLARSGVAAAYTSILADLDDAIAGLPVLNTQIYYANASAAKMLKARVLINRGAAGDYATVISLASGVISSGTFSLEGNVKDVFLTNGLTSKEVIMGLTPYATQSHKFLINQELGNYAVSDTLVSLLKNDPRNQWVYKADQGSTSYGYYYGGINELTKYYSGSVTNPVQTTLSETCYAFRLTEAYLMEAEAIALSGGDLAKAKTLLITVETHAGVTDFTAINNAASAAALQTLIVREEMRNFVSENGADWLALRRLPLATVKTIQPALTSVNALILPIPYTELSVNNLAIQNPGY